MRVQSFAELGESLATRPPRLADIRVVAVDGRSGSGKTTFATRLARERARAGVDVALVHTDDLLDGWGHPSNFEPYLRQWLLDPLAAGCRARYRVYDWRRHRFGPDWCDIGRPELLILEGVTTASARWRPLLSLSVLIAVDPDLAIGRSLERDGPQLRAELERWRAAEDAHFPADRTAAHVDVIVDGDPNRPHDPETEFVRLDGAAPADPGELTGPDGTRPSRALTATDRPGTEPADGRPTVPAADHARSRPRERVGPHPRRGRGPTRSTTADRGCAAAAPRRGRRA